MLFDGFGFNEFYIVKIYHGDNKFFVFGVTHHKQLYTITILPDTAKRARGIW